MSARNRLPTAKFHPIYPDSERPCLRTSWLAPITACLLAFLVSCSEEEKPNLEQIFDLAEELAFAEVEAEPGDLAIGTQAGRRYLGGGWSTRNESGQAGNYVWAVGETSELKLPILHPRPLRLHLRCAPFHFTDAPAQILTVELGGRPIFTGELAPGLQDLVVDIPSSGRIEGDTVLGLRWAWHRSPAEALGTSDRRSLAAACYDMHLEGGQGEMPTAKEGRFWLPWGSSADFYLDLPPGSVFETAARSTRGQGEAALHILESGEARRISLAPHDRPRRIALPSGRQHLRFLAVQPSATSSGNSGDETGGMMLLAPRILAPKLSLDTRAAQPENSLATAALETGDSKAPSILLYSIDTLRADRLGLYGGSIPTPELEAFSAQALVFERATAQSSWTKASMASALTGLWPPAHGAINRRQVLVPERVTIQELLSASGYETAAFITNPNLTAVFGFDQGFDHFEELAESTDADKVHERVDQWLSQRADRERPLFLWVHTLDPHAPYAPPEAARQRWAPRVSEQVADNSQRLLDDLRSLRRPMEPELLADLLALYDAEAAFADQAFGQFLGMLERQGLGNAAAVVLSDHGEEFLEHGNLEHGRSLFQESIHVPLIVRAPLGHSLARVGRSSRPVHHLDVFPTLACLAGISAPVDLEGRCLLREDSSMVERQISSHLHLDGAERLALSRGQQKLTAERLADGRLGRWRLFDLEADAEEQEDLSGARTVLRGWLATEMRRKLAARAAAAEIELDPEMRARLEALGYL